MRGIIAMLGGIMRWRLRGRWQWVGLGVFYVWIMAVSLLVVLTWAGSLAVTWGCGYGEC